MEELTNEAASDDHYLLHKEEVLDDLEITYDCEDNKDLVTPKEELCDTSPQRDSDVNEQNVNMVMPIKTELILSDDLAQLRKQHQLCYAVEIKAERDAEASVAAPCASKSENLPSSRPQSPEDVKNPLVPGFQVSATPGGSINLKPDAVLLQRSSRMASPTPGPSSLSPGLSSSSLKRRRSQRSLDCGRSRRPLTPIKTTEIKALIADSGSEIEEGEGEDDDMDDFMVDVGETVEGETSNVERMRRIVTDLRSEIILVEEAEDEVQGNLGGGNGDSSQFSWSEDFSTFSGQKTEFRGSPGPTQISLDPVDIFEYFWGEDIISTIVEETNRYARQMLEIAAEHRVPSKNLMQWTETDAPEIYRLLAVIMLMTFNYRANIKDYWTTGILEMGKFGKLMSRDRYLQLIQFLHFVDIDTMPNYELSYDKKISKIAPIVKHCNIKFSEYYKPIEFLSLDESLLLWKGRFGIKSFELCEAGTGYQLKFILYAGKGSSFVQEPIHGFENPTAKVVLELMNEFLDLGHTLVMDNWYNQLPLTRFLKSRGTDVIGTMNRNRKNVPLDVKNQENSLQRGAALFRHCGDISLVCWNDVKLVTAISTYHREDMVPSRRAGVNILKPCAINDHNSFMGGVDLKDQKLSMFLMERKRGSKWYHRVFRRLVNTSILNAFLIYKRNPTFRVMTHREFRVKLAEGLLRKYQVSCAPSVRTLPEREVRLDQQYNHFPIQVPAGPHKRATFVRNRCVRCAAANRRRETTVKCSKCSVFLCLGDCWKDYHTLHNLAPSSSS